MFMIFDVKIHQLIEKITITDANELTVLNRLQRTQKKNAANEKKITLCYIK